MKFNINLGIRSAVLIPMSIVVLVFITFALSVYFAINSLYSNHIKIFNHSISELSELTIITDEFKSLRTDVYRIFQENEELIFTIELQNIKNKVEKLHFKLEQKFDRSLFQDSITDIILQIENFYEILGKVSQYATSRIFIENQRQDFIKKLHYLNEQLIVLKKENKHINLDIIQNILTKLLILNSSTDIFYGVKIYNLLNVELTKLKVLQQDFENSEVKNDYQIFTICQRIFDLILQENNIIDTFFAYGDNLEEKIDLKIQFDVLSNELNQVNITLLNQVDNFSDNYSLNFENRIENILLYIILILLLIMLMAYSVYKVLSNYIVNPLVKLDFYIKNYLNQVECYIDVCGALEVQEISREVCNFIKQLEERENKLIDSHNNLEKLVEERTKKISQLSEQIISLQEEERIKLAAELHDDIGSSIGTIKLSIERASKLLQVTSMQETKEKKETQEILNSTVHIIKSITRQLRRIQTDLRPPHLNLGLLKTLEWYVIDYGIAHPEMDLQTEFFFDELLLSSSLRIVTFRIIQEAMNNVSKHSVADKVSIKISDENGFTIIIEDNGKGFDLEALNHNKDKISHGIRNIQERVTISGGELKIISREGEGTCVIAHWKMVENGLR